MISIIIADDHQLVAQALKKLIEENMEAQCTIANTIAETQKALSELQPDILLLDIALPDGDGLDAISMLRQSSISTRIIILTMYAEPSVILRAKCNNVDGYVLKNNSTDELCEAIQQVAQGNNYFSQQTIELAKGQEAAPQLTPREREVLRMLTQGMTVKEIAQSLFLSFETVHSYTKYLRQKLGCKNTAALVHTAMRLHLV